MPMTFVDRTTVIRLACQATILQYCRLATQSHRSTHARDFALFIEQANHRVRCIAIELAGMSTLQADDVATVFDHGALHT